MPGTYSARNLTDRLAGWMQPFTDALHRADLAARAGADRRCHPRPGAADRRRCLARHGTRSGTQLHQLPPRAEPQSVVGRWVARRLFRLLVDTFVPDGPVVIGIDDTIERRWGAQDRGARHLSRPGALLARPLRQDERPALALADGCWFPIPWTRRRWALPFLTVLAPSERYAHAHTGAVTRS